LCVQAHRIAKETFREGGDEQHPNSHTDSMAIAMTVRIELE